MDLSSMTNSEFASSLAPGTRLVALRRFVASAAAALFALGTAVGISALGGCSSGSTSAQNSTNAPSASATYLNDTAPIQAASATLIVQGMSTTWI